MRQFIHEVQVSILSNLRHVEAARFSELMRPTGWESDAFKFHLGKLVQTGHVERTDSGVYRLTAQGKEFANNLDEEEYKAQRQPKLSLLLCVSKASEQEDEPLYLFQKRLRNPFFGFWGLLSGAIRWGETAEDAAARELKKQTGLEASCEVRTFFRQRDFSEETDLLLEDKLFVVLKATNLCGDLSNDWYAGYNQWMTLAEFEKQQHYLPTAKVINAIHTGQTYASYEIHYKKEEY